MIAALAPEEDGSPTATDLKVSIKFAMAVLLATTFTSETFQAVPPQAPRVRAIPVSIRTFAEAVGGVPVLDMMEPHSDSKPIYLQASYGPESGAPEIVPPLFRQYGRPRGTESRLAFPETENRGHYRSSTVLEPGTGRNGPEYNRYSNEEY